MSVELKAGQWYRNKSGDIVYCAGKLQTWAWIIKDNEGGSTQFFGPAGGEIAEHLPDCTGFDWQPTKSLSKILQDLLNDGTRYTADTAHEHYQRKAVRFLKAALEPPAGKTLGQVLSEAWGHSWPCAGPASRQVWEQRGQLFLKALTGIDL